MGEVVSLLLLFVAAAAFVVSALIGVSVWRLWRNRKWLYTYLTLYPIFWVLILERLFALINVPLA
jgi:hypothetical protein